MPVLQCAVLLCMCVHKYRPVHKSTTNIPECLVDFQLIYSRTPRLPLSKEERQYRVAQYAANMHIINICIKRTRYIVA